MDKRFQVFVSSTYGDLIEERKVVMDMIQEFGYIPAGMENFPAEHADALSLIYKIIDRSDYYVLIMAARYGSVDPKTGLSYTELEYDYALSRGLHVIPFAHSDIRQRTVAQSEEDPALKDKLHAFRSKVEKSHHRKSWTTKEDLMRLLPAALMHAVNVYPATGWVRGDAIAKATELQDRLNETLKQLEIQRDLNRELQQRVDSLSEFESFDDLANGEDNLRIDFVVSFHAEKGQPKRPSERVSVQTTWDRVFSAVAAPLFASEYLFKITEAIEKEHLPDLALASEASPSLVTVSRDQIRNQLRSLQVIDLVMEDSHSQVFVGRNEMWILTPFGSRFLARYVAQLRDSSLPSDSNEPPKPTEN